MTPLISAQLGVGSCAVSVVHFSALPRPARRLLDLDGLSGVIPSVLNLSASLEVSLYGC
jgi:hypothetical protein